MHLRLLPNIKKYVTLSYQGVLVDSTNVIIKQKLSKCKLLNCQMSHNFHPPWIGGQLKSYVSVSVLSTFYFDNVIIQNAYSNEKKTERVQNETVCMYVCVCLPDVGPTPHPCLSCRTGVCGSVLDPLFTQILPRLAPYQHGTPDPGLNLY